MTFGLVGDLIHGGTTFVTGAIDSVHHHTDKTLDAVGLSAFIPPVLHEASDGLLATSRDVVGVVGHNAGSILQGLDKVKLHQHDPALMGNIRGATGASFVPMNNTCMQQFVPQQVCIICQFRPQVGTSPLCGRCAEVAYLRAQHHSLAGQYQQSASNQGASMNTANMLSYGYTQQRTKYNHSF